MYTWYTGIYTLIVPLVSAHAALQYEYEYGTGTGRQVESYMYYSTGTPPGCMYEYFVRSTSIAVYTWDANNELSHIGINYTLSGYSIVRPASVRVRVPFVVINTP